MHDTAVWNEIDNVSGCCDPGNNIYFQYEMKYIMMGDTTMSGYHYKKIFWQTYGIDANTFGCGNWNGDFFKLYFLGFIREDSSKKVYFKADSANLPVPECDPLPADSEVVLFDFNLEVGDTVQWKPYNKTVLEIDSVQAPNDEYLRRIIFDNLTSDYWIEGLGSAFAFFGSYLPPPFECGCYLSCVQATDLLPPNSPPPCGGIANSVIDFQTKRGLHVTPDPFSDFVSLTSPFQSSSILSVMNSQGQIVLKKQLLPFEKISFTKEELGNDEIIFFRLVSNEGTSQSAIALHIF